MPSSAPLTIDDLDAIADQAFASTDPSPIVTELVTAVDQDRVADQFAAAHALLLASEIVEKTGDLPAAVGLAERAAALPSEDGFARACYAELLVKSGREEEGLKEFAAVRPELSHNPLAPGYVGEALEACGHAALGVEWLTDVALELLEGEDDDADQLEVLFEAVKERHRLREGLELEHDDLDSLFHQMAEAEGPVEGQALLFWPEPELAVVLSRWPDRADIYGASWDEHRTGVETTMAGWSAAGATQLGLLAGSIEGLQAFAAAEGADPGDPETHAGYADRLAESAGVTEWPPQRNATCWCGSGGKYKKCCLPRSRG